MRKSKEQKSVSNHDSPRKLIDIYKNILLCVRNASFAG